MIARLSFLSRFFFHVILPFFYWFKSCAARSGELHARALFGVGGIINHIDTTPRLLPGHNFSNFSGLDVRYVLLVHRPVVMRQTIVPRTAGAVASIFERIAFSFRYILSKSRVEHLTD
ncbi:MAG: hypothetical protein RJB10_2060 [Pseudomonadota bacterium]|jgi:hypothetical protein